MASDDLQVHGVVVSNQTRLGSGKAVAVTHVSFYIGDHGPFQHDFIEPNNKPADIQAYIQQQVNDLRSIVTRTY